MALSGNQKTRIGGINGYHAYAVFVAKAESALWTGVAAASTTWTDKAGISTTWTDKAAVSTTWTDKAGA